MKNYFKTLRKTEKNVESKLIRKEKKRERKYLHKAEKEAKTIIRILENKIKSGCIGNDAKVEINIDNKIFLNLDDIEAILTSQGFKTSFVWSKDETNDKLIVSLH